MKPANYLVQTSDGQLHCYWSLDILLCDLSIRRGETVTLYAFFERGFFCGYKPTTEGQLRAQFAKEA